MTNLTNVLFESSPVENRCPNLRKDDVGPYCARKLKENTPIEQERRLVCDDYSLQLWCLDKERCPNCIFYQGEPFRARVR